MAKKAQKEPEQKPKDWTVMVYLGGDNNLSEECLWSIKELYRVGVTERYAVVAQYDTPAGGILRYDLDNIAVPAVVRGSKVAQVSSDRTDDTDGSLSDRHAVQVRGLRDRSASITAIREFVKHCVKLHPAKHYILVLSGHAGGAVGRFLLSEGFPPGNLSIRELGITMSQIDDFFQCRGRGERLDILGLDACAMSMAEVGYELKGNVNYMVGAEGFEPSSGWPYHRLLEDLRADPTITPKPLAKKIVENYISYYADFAVAGRSTDQTACNLDNHENLRSAIDKLATLLIKKIDEPRVKDAIILAHWRAQSYKFEEYVDLWDFCDLLAAARVDAGVTSACKTVRNAIYGEGGDASNYVLKSCYSGAEYQYSRGLSIYFPWVLDRRSLEPYKNRLFFTEDTNWGSFVEKYVKATRREPRGWSKLRKSRSQKSSADGRFFTEDGRIFTEHDKIFTEHDKIFTKHDKIVPGIDDRVFTEHDKIFTEHDKIFTEHDKIGSGTDDRIFTEHDKIGSATDDRIFTEHDKIGSGTGDRIFTEHDRIFTEHDKGDLLTPRVKNPPIISLRTECVD